MTELPSNVKRQIGRLKYFVNYWERAHADEIRKKRIQHDITRQYINRIKELQAVGDMVIALYEGRTKENAEAILAQWKDIRSRGLDFFFQVKRHGKRQKKEPLRE